MIAVLAHGGVLQPEGPVHLVALFYLGAGVVFVGAWLLLLAGLFYGASWVLDRVHGR